MIKEFFIGFVVLGFLLGLAVLIGRWIILIPLGVIACTVVGNLITGIFKGD